MEALYTQFVEDDGAMIEEEEEDKSREQEEWGMEASSSMGFSTDEETDEDEEPEPPPVVRRKVSFADAFGLDLVSVKEYDNVDVTESEACKPAERDLTHPLEEFYISCLFTVPSSPEELDHRLQAQMVELESIELLPGTTTFRGIIRVVNLCFSKSVYARITLDKWNSFFDLLAEYVPGSSDRKTDRFTFKYTVVPRLERDGTRVEFCLRYETSVGTFWANNKEMNYVMFCHQKVHVKEHGPVVQEEGTRLKSTRSCLKANRRGMARDTMNPATAGAEAEAPQNAEEAFRNTVDSAQIQTLLYQEEHRNLVDSIKSRQRAARLARVKELELPKASSHDTTNDKNFFQPMAAPWGSTANVFSKIQKKQSSGNPRILTYHQIPLTTLDWNNDKPQQWETPNVDDIWTGRVKWTLSKKNKKDTLSVSDIWETFLKGKDDTTDKDTSVCDAWQAFLNGQSSEDHSTVPESEWLQTAASVSPSNNKEPQIQHESQAGKDAPTLLQSPTSTACQLRSDTHEISVTSVALNTEDQPAGVCDRVLRGENTTKQDTTKVSQTNSVTDTLREFMFVGAMPVSKGSVVTSTGCHNHAVLELESEGLIEKAEGGDEPCNPHIAGIVTSSGDTETTDMTAIPDPQNASAVDRISWGASLEKGLSHSRDGELTGTAHNAMDDMLAFWETITQETKDGERFVFSAARQGVETNCTESTEEMIFRPQKAEECEISQRYADENQCEEFRLNQNSENPFKHNERDGNEIQPAQFHSDEVNLNQKCENIFRQSQISDSEKEDAASQDKYLGMKQKGSTNGTERLTGTEQEMFQLLHGEAGIQKDEDPTLKKTEENSAVKSQAGEHEIISDEAEERVSLSCTEIIQGKQEPCIEINQSAPTAHTVELRKRKKVFQLDCDTFGPFPTYKCDQSHIEVLEMGLTRSQEDMKSHDEDVGSAISSDEVTANVSKADISPELRDQPEILERIEEDMSQRDKDERVSIRNLKIAAVGELIGNVENPQGERSNAPAELKKLSAEVESSPRVEYKELSDGTKNPIVTENTAALEVIESGLDKTFTERFREDLVRGIWEEALDQKSNVQASCRDVNIGAGLGMQLTEASDSTHDCHPFSKTEVLDPGVLPVREPTYPNLSHGLEQTLSTESNAFSTERGKKPTKSGFALQPEQRCLSQLKTDLNSSASHNQDLNPTLASQVFGSAKDHTQNWERSQQAKGRRTEDDVVAHKESLNQWAHPCHTHLSPLSQKSKQSNGLVWWSVLYILSHITRLLICGLLVAGFFIVFLYDFPAFFAMYIFSLSWWFYKWKKYQGTMNKGMVD